MLNKRKPKTLTISYWNANSAVHKKAQMEHFLQVSNIDILLVSEFFFKPGPLIVAGDFNSKHQHGYEIVGLEHPTYYRPPDRPDTIDLAAMRNIRHHYEVEVLYDMDSDHNPVVLKLACGGPEYDTTTIKKKTNWTAYSQHLQKNALNIKLINSPQETEEAFEILEQNINTAITHATSYIIKPLYNPNDIPPDLKKLIRAKKRAELTKSPEDHARNNQLQNRVRNELASHHNQRWNQTLDEIEKNGKAFWKMTKRIRNKRITFPPLQSKTCATLTRKKPKLLQGRSKDNAFYATIQMKTYTGKSKYITRQIK